MLQNLQNLQNSAKFQKCQLDNLVDFEKCCKTRICLQRSVLTQPKRSEILPKICQKLETTPRVHLRGAHAGLRRRARRAGRGAALPAVARGRAGELRLHLQAPGPRLGLPARGVLPFRLPRCGGRGVRHCRSADEILGVSKIGKISKFCKFCKFLAGSFSAVSKRNFARKYAFDSIFQALQDLHSFAPLQSQNFRKKSV